MKTIRNNRIIGIVLLMIMTITSLPLGMTTKSLAADTSVSDVTGLQNAVTNATDGDVITLADGFAYGNATLTVPNVNVTIDGGNNVWNVGTITVNGAGTGSLKITNLKFETSTVERAFNIKASGKIVLDNVLVENRTFGVGGAIEVESSAKLSIRNSTFKNNVATAQGYSGGAIYAKGFNGEFIVENSIFEGNETTMGGSVYGGEGGAIAFNILGSKANITFKNSYFKGNKAAVELGGKLADGGAIGIFNTVNGAKITIDGNTFEANVAGDDGGAVFIQSNDVINTGIVFRNNTFYKNEALSKSKTQTYSGGAIQLYGNGGPFQGRLSYFDFENNTFVENTAVSEGGAIGFTGYITNAVGGKLKNNLFSGNSGKKDITNNIGALDKSIVNDLGGNIGIDNGTATTETVEKSFGKYGVLYGDNQTSIEAGYSEGRIKIPTALIIPGGSADEKATADITDNMDQRDFSRGIKPYDSGAVEISWVKYNANGGAFGLDEMTSYDGKVYYEKDAEDNEETNAIKDKITSYYTVGYIAGDTKVLDGEADLDITKDNKVFKGWSTDKDATEADANYPVGKELTYVSENLTLYAVWGDLAQYTVTYDVNGGTGSQTDANNSYTENSEVTVLDKNDMAKANHTFTGWNTKADGTGTPYAVGAKFNITEDTILYAQWKEDEKATVTYDANTGTGSQIDSNSPYYLNGEVTVLDKNDMAKTNHTFTGWNTKADGTGTPYAAGDKFIITEDITLYAQWKETAKPPVDPTNPGEPGGTIKDITLVGGRATLTDKMRAELSNFKQHELYGKDRYVTSVQVSKAYKNSDTIVLASGEKYTDELTATVLASKLDVPILLSEKDVVPEVVIKEIERLGATKVILIGEKGTLSKSVETQLSKYKLERIGGVDRYETAVLIGDQVRTITGNKTQSILVDGTNFPDAIAMTSMGVEQGLPIILTQPNELNKITEKAVKDWGITKVTIGGGTASVSSNIESTLKSTVEVERIKGTDRYETSVLVAKQVYNNPTHAVIASGEVFPDAIVGAPYAAKNKYPIVLSRGNSVPQVVLNYVNGK